MTNWLLWWTSSCWWWWSRSCRWNVTFLTSEWDSQDKDFIFRTFWWFFEKILIWLWFKVLNFICGWTVELEREKVTVVFGNNCKSEVTSDVFLAFVEQRCMMKLCDNGKDGCSRNRHKWKEPLRLNPHGQKRLKERIPFLDKMMSHHFTQS